MAGIPGIGGQNRVSADAHRLAGTWRPDRHGVPAGGELVTLLSAADRARAVLGLAPDEQHHAEAILDGYEVDAVDLPLVRAYVRAIAALERLQSTNGDPREVSPRRAPVAQSQARPGALMRRRPPLNLPGIPPGDVDLLLRGYSIDDAFAEFVGDDELRDVWRTHRAALLREAARLNIKKPPGLRFDSVEVDDDDTFSERTDP